MHDLKKERRSLPDLITVSFPSFLITSVYISHTAIVGALPGRWDHVPVISVSFHRHMSPHGI